MISLIALFLFPLLYPLPRLIDAQSGTNPFPTQSPDSYPPPTVTTAERDNWIGTWSTIPGCTPSLTCCCGKGDATITAGPAAGTINMVGATDGGPGCFGFSSLSGVFIVKTPLYSFYNITTISTVVDLNMTTDHSKIAMKINNPIIQCNQQPMFARQIATTPSPTATTTTPPISTTSSGATLPRPLYSDADYSAGILRLANDNASALLIFDLSIDSTTPPALPNAAPPLDYAVLHYTLCASCPEINVALRAYTTTLYGSNSFLSQFLNSNLNRSSVAHYVYGPIAIRTTGEDTLLYYFTYSLSGTATDTRMYMYNPANINPTTTPSPTMSTTTTTRAPTTSTPHSEPLTNSSYAGRSLVGNYATDNTCVSSPSCCCAVGNIRLASPYDDMAATTATAALLTQLSGSTTPFVVDADHQVLVRARLDGSSACLGQSDITGLFTINNERIASINLRGVTIATDLSNDKNTLSFTNSIYQNCVTKASRTSANGPTTQIPVPSINATTPPPASQPIDTTPILGVWNSDPNACHVSPSCCCVSGQVSVKNNATVMNTVDVTFTLVGERYSCYQMDRGTITLPFTVVNYSYAYYSPPGMPFVRFEALSNANYSRILIKNTVQQDCVSAVYRQGLHYSAAFAYERSSSMAWIMATATIAVSMALWKKKGHNANKNKIATDRADGRMEEENECDHQHH